ncbi:MAG: response regulator [Chloroflexi bacterium]|nr:response regulator [Chloroflexota bacterium]
MLDSPIHALLIEDDPEDALLIGDDLAAIKGGRFRLTHIERLIEGLLRLGEGDIDVVLLDLNLPDSRGLETLIGARAWAPAMPIIVLTGLDDEETAIQAVAQGAQDYLIKGDLNPPLLARTLRYAIERQRLKTSVDRSAVRLRQVITNIADGVLVVDMDGIVHFANPAAETIFARSADELVGLALDFPLVDKETTEVEIVRGAGRTVTVEIRTVPIEWEGKPAILASLRDVTEARERQRYQQSQERLATVGQLAAGIAHDFNNIMGAIILYAQILMKIPNLTIRQNESLEMIHSQARLASNLIHQILDFSRRSVMELGPMDLLPFAKETVRMLERTLPENIHLRLTYDQEEYQANADPTRLQQALMNLALNARDAMPKGGELHIDFTTRTLTPDDIPPLPDMGPGKWIVLSVADTGTGIAPEHLPHLFEPFFTIKEPGRGTGLGLAQVYGIIAQHKGSIAVDSQVGRGTTFTIYLPAREDKIPATAIQQMSYSSLDGQATILLVEDNTATAQAVLGALEALGYEVLLAGDGLEALSIYAAHAERIDLVLSDLVMPRLGGIDLYKELNTHYPEVKFIAMTGYPLADGGKALLKQGIVDWIFKPFDIADLARRLRAALEGS